MEKFIDKLIQSFTNQEYREFKYFLLRRPNTVENRKDILMLDDIRNKKEATSERKSNAAYQIKKRLKKQLEMFAALENLRYDKNIDIHAEIDISKFLFRKNLYTDAINCLNKAEKLAEAAGDYKTLDQILDIRISHSYNMAIPALHDEAPVLITKMLANKKQEVKESYATAAYCELIYEIRKALAKKLSTNIDELKTTIFKKYHLDDNHDTDNLQSYCSYASIIIVMLREEKNYEALKEFGINCYNVISSKNELDSVSKDFLYNLLDGICIATMRSKDYINYEKFIPLYFAQIQKMKSGSYEKNFYDFIEYIDLADLYFVTNRLPQARVALLIAKKKYAGFTQSNRIFFTLRMYLMAMHFMHSEYAECIKLYREFIQFDEKKLLGELYFNLEHLLLTDIYSALFYYEDGDTDYALHVLTQLKRKYATVLKSESSARELFFIKILQKILTVPAYIRSKQFKTDAEKFISLKQFMPADWEYISLNVWLTAKSTRKDYYSCFLEEVKPS
jgi:hypothetical protein